MASLNGNEAIVKLLLGYGAEVNAEGGSALQAASFIGNKEIVELAARLSEVRSWTSRT